MEFFTTLRLFSSDGNYGMNHYDAHMSKNTEWGAIAYLSQSKYGLCNNKVCSTMWVNNVNAAEVAGKIGPGFTGCSGTSMKAGMQNNMTACESGYDYKQLGVRASTTGNIYGIYDLFGGAWERMMAIVIGEDGNYNMSNSGVTSMPSQKYWDAYPLNTDATNISISKLGDAMREVKKLESGAKVNWNGSSVIMPIVSAPWFSRGASMGYGSEGGLFYVGNTIGQAYINAGSRVILVVEE